MLQLRLPPFERALVNAASGSARALKALLRTAPELAARPFKSQGVDEYPLTWAVRRIDVGHAPLRAVDALLEAGADPNQGSVNDGLSPFADAMTVRRCFGQPDLLTALLEGGGDPHACSGPADNPGPSALALALAGDGPAQPHHWERPQRLNADANATASVHAMWRRTAKSGQPWPSASAWFCWAAALEHRSAIWTDRLLDAGANPVPFDTDLPAQTRYGLAHRACFFKEPLRTQAFRALLRAGVTWTTRDPTLLGQQAARETFLRMQAQSCAQTMGARWKASTEERARARF